MLKKKWSYSYNLISLVLWLWFSLSPLCLSHFLWFSLCSINQWGQLCFLSSFLWNISRETAAARNPWRTSQNALSIPIYTKRTVNIQPEQQAASISLYLWESCQHDLLATGEQLKQGHMLSWNRPHSNIIQYLPRYNVFLFKLTDRE